MNPYRGTNIIQSEKRCIENDNLEQDLLIMKINTNIHSINTQKSLNRNDKNLDTPLERLSSAKRINSAKDDAAGLAIVARMAAQISGTNTSIRNLNDGISLAQTADGALSQASEMLHRIRDIAVQSANATNSPADRKALQEEVGQLTSELNRIAGTAEFNGKKLLDGSFSSALFQAGANPGQTITATSGNFSTNQYGDYRVEGEGTTVAAGDRIATAGSIDISGSTGTATVNYNAGDSAKNIAAAINNTSENTGVAASAETQVELQFSASGSYNLNIAADDGIAKNVSFNIDATNGVEALSQVATAFNEHTASTGVVASINDSGTGIVLNHYNGETINVSDTNTANAGNVTVSSGITNQTLTADAIADSAVATGKVTFDSADSFVTQGTAGDITSNASEAAQLLEIAELDVSTVDMSNKALAMVDAAISSISSQRANYGALQSKFESSIRHSENYSVNLSASRSRIEDTDYAKETADLARMMILKDAGTAMLGQANMVPHFAMGLLNGK